MLFGDQEIMAVWKKLVRLRMIPVAQKRSEISWLGNWLRDLKRKIQGYFLLKYREYLQKFYSLNTWCLTEHTNVPRSDTTNNKTFKERQQLQPSEIRKCEH